MFTIILIHVFFVAQIDALHQLAHSILLDNDVNTVLFGHKLLFPNTYNAKRNEIVCNIINCVLTCEFWILFLFVDVSELYVTTQLFMALRFSAKLKRSETLILVIGAILWFVVRSPHCVNLVYYQIFTTPATAYQIVETNMKQKPMRIKSADIHFYCWVSFWVFSVYSFSRSVHWFDVGLLPITFYTDVVIWKNYLGILSRV
jgi:hypothetical protein